jgi:snapalysin
MRHRTTVMTAVLGLGLAAALGAAPAATAAAHHHSASGHPGAPALNYAGATGSSTAGSSAFADSVMQAAAAKRAANPGVKTVTITYDAATAPHFATQIARARDIWNSSVSAVKLVAGRQGHSDFGYREGYSSHGSYASTDNHGHGHIFLDFRQTKKYNSVRVVAHETGHVLGLHDHYSGPCSELMSGSGPGTSCQNAHPNAVEIAMVNELWSESWF